MGQAVTWLVPHQLTQVLPNDVDYRVMLTFLEFYATMLRFVHFRLYHSTLSPPCSGSKTSCCCLPSRLQLQRRHNSAPCFSATSHSIGRLRSASSAECGLL